MKSVDLIKLRDAAEAAGTDGRALGRYSRAMACAISALEAAEAENAELRAQLEASAMPVKYFTEGGVIHGVYGSSSIDYVEQLRARVAELEGFCKTYVEAIQVLIDKKDDV
jgi:hypothetical protein